MDNRPLTQTDDGGLHTQLVNSHWYRVAGVVPRLRRQLRVHAHRYRGRLWYVVEDHLNGRYHRFDRRAWRIIQLLDGTLTLAQLWHRLASEAGADTPSQEDILVLLGQLHSLDLLASESLPDLAEAARRERSQSRQRRWQRYMNPLALRFRLFDPDRFLVRAVRVLKPVLNRRGVLLWLIWVLPAIVLAVSHWAELTSNFGERVLALDNLALLWLIFPLVKSLHEIGHGIACRLRGGVVHDMGVMLLIFLPVPYVDASSAWAFANKRDRMLVGAAGMLVELAIAATAFYLWLWLQPGTAKAIAYDAAVLASVTTVFFNGNPLLRYDGYYIVSDALEIPNLAQRAIRYWGYLAERCLLRRRELQSPVMARGETFWFAIYAPLSFAYRMIVLFSIAMFISHKYFAIGAFIALWGLVAGLGLPLYRGFVWLRRILFDAQSGARGWRIALAAVGALAVLLFVVPLPYHTQVEGVLWLPDSGVLRAGQTGSVSRVVAHVGELVRPGTDIVQLRNSTLSANVVEQSAKVAAARVRYDAVRLEDPSRGQELASDLDLQEAELHALQERAGRLDVRSAASGRLWLNDSENLPGQYVKQGQVLGYVIPAAAPRVRVIVDQADADFIRSHTRRIEVKLPFAPGPIWAARVVRAVPAASTELPSAALGRQGGGAVATDPRDESGRKALVSHFEFELALPDRFPYRFIGSRASVRFVHPAEPLIDRMSRGVRRLFLVFFHS
ncbi:MAG TPA: HlyD family efflux transporter periplasmic adaptor subunit [Candidatus Binataceae bacterium]|nr:HlyD family efflux transporter periplasmic adaptor subunit [Candidatus Binataceae bacterium]